MKQFVNLIQLAIIAAIVFPMYYVWDTGKIDTICEEIQPGLTKVRLLELVDDYGVSIEGPHDQDIAGGKWHARLIDSTPFIEHSCSIKGVGNTVATAKLD